MIESSGVSRRYVVEIEQSGGDVCGAIRARSRVNRTDTITGNSRQFSW